MDCPSVPVAEPLRVDSNPPRGAHCRRKQVQSSQRRRDNASRLPVPRRCSYQFPSMSHPSSGPMAVSSLSSRFLDLETDAAACFFAGSFATVAKTTPAERCGSGLARRRAAARALRCDAAPSARGAAKFACKVEACICSAAEQTKMTERAASGWRELSILAVVDRLVRERSGRERSELCSTHSLPALVRHRTQRVLHA